MQRVHMDDLTGFVTSQSDAWEVPNLPVIAEIEETIPVSDTEIHRRRVGEVPSPEREPLSVLERMKISTRRRRVLSAVSANTGPARRRHDQARLWTCPRSGSAREAAADSVTTTAPARSGDDPKARGRAGKHRDNRADKSKTPNSV